jgi:hypothetical protein
MHRLAFWLLAVIPAGITAQDFNGTFVGMVNGAETTLMLRHDGDVLAGAVIDASGEYDLRGRVDGEMATGTISGGTGAAVHFHATSAGPSIQVTMFPFDWHGEPLHDAGTVVMFAPQQGAIAAGASVLSPTPGTSTAEPSKDLDPVLIGTWVKEDITIDATFSYVSVTVMEFRPDGTYLQYSGGSAGGSGSVSVRSDPGGEVIRADWRARTGVIEARLAGSDSWVPVARYYVEANKLMLTYLEDGRRDIWQRR